MIKNTIKKTQPYSSDTKHIEQNTLMSKLNNIWICSKNINNYIYDIVKHEKHIKSARARGSKARFSFKKKVQLSKT